MYTISRIGGVYLARSAIVVGDVTMGTDCNVWHGCVIRGDVAPIRIGERVNIQDGAVLHCKHNVPLEIASDVVIAHMALVHCKSIGPRTLIGSRATVLDDCEIGEDCLIAAGALLPPGTTIPPGSVVMGCPGQVVRAIGDSDREYIQRVLKGYVHLAARHAAGEFRPYGGGV